MEEKRGEEKEGKVKFCSLHLFNLALTTESTAVSGFEKTNHLMVQRLM